MKKMICGWVVVCLAIYPSKAQLTNPQQLTQNLKGRIIDQVSKSPVIGATVAIINSEPLRGTTTDVEGYFSLRNVPIGRVSLAVSSVGYEQRVLSNLEIESGKEKFINVELVESLIEMEELVIVASDQEQGKPLNELASVSAISISIEETSRYAATFDDPARAALTFAGVATGGDDLLNEIVIRGNSPKGILWRLEGVEVPNPNHFGSVGSSAGGISMLSSNVLSNSDFFTGAFPAEYGNATSGIFDLSLRQGNFDTHEHTLQAGLLGLAAASEGPINKEKRSSYLANYRYSTLALFDNLGIQILGDQEDVTFQDLSFKVNLPGTKAGSFSIWGLGGLNTYTYTPQEEVGEWDFEDNTQTVAIGGLTHVAYLNDDTFIKSVASFSFFESDYAYDSLRVRVLEDERVRETAFRLSSYLNTKFDARNSLRVGGIFSNLGYDLFQQEWQYQQQELVSFLDEDGSTQFIQGFANWQHRAGKSVTMNVGFHASYFGLNEDIYLEPRLGLRWATSPKGTVTFGAGLHSRMETLALYMSSQQQEDGTQIRHNDDLGFTRAAHTVVGYEWMLASNLRFKTEVYYQYLYDVPIWGQDTTTSDFLRSFSVLNTYDGWTSDPLANEGTGQNYGLELTLEKFLSNGYYFLSTLSLYESSYKGLDEVSRPTRFDGGYIFNVIGGKEWSLGRSGNKTLSANGRFIYSGGKREAPIDIDASREAGFTIRDFSRNYDMRLDEYIRFDIGITYKVNRPKSTSAIALNVQNAVGRTNEFGRYYSSFSDAVVSEGQVGMFPNLSYRISF
ncbi:MAG: TonB-dependent receptor [Bacteroidota bacterium]